MLNVKLEKIEHNQTALEESPVSHDVQNNPWSILSLYELLHFNCPSCNFKHSAKQDFVTHALNAHKECIPYLKNIKDNSMEGIVVEWNLIENLKDDATSGINDVSCDDNIKLKNEHFETKFKLKIQDVHKILKNLKFRRTECVVVSIQNAL